MLKILYVYRFATFGGVERVLLSRAEAFRRHGIAVRMFLYFFEDFGACQAIQKYVHAAGLTDYVTLVTTIADSDYDLVVSIDTPEILGTGIDGSKLLFECHTTYVRERIYLSRLPGDVNMIAVPSVAMKADCERLYPALRDKFFLLRNFVATSPAEPYNGRLIWGKRPLLYLGRMDDHKNIRELLDIFACYRRRHGDDMMLILVGSIDEAVNLEAELKIRGIGDRTVVLPPVRFDRVQQVLSLVKGHGGIFISSSRDESFGLSAAEALASGLPVLLSGIRAHADLVGDDLPSLYPLGDVTAAADKLRTIAAGYDYQREKVSGWHGRFSADGFIEDWNCFVKRVVPDKGRPC